MAAFTVERQQRVTRPAENGGGERLTAGGDLFRGRVGAPGGAGAIVPQDLADFSVAATGGAKKNRRAFFQLMRKHAIDAASFKS